MFTFRLIKPPCHVHHDTHNIHSHFTQKNILFKTKQLLYNIAIDDDDAGELISSCAIAELVLMIADRYNRPLHRSDVRSFTVLIFLSRQTTCKRL